VKHLFAGFVAACSCLLLSPAWAAPDCDAADNAELCVIAEETRADNPSFADLRSEGAEGERRRSARHAARRARARGVLNALVDPTWRDLFRAGYVIAYGDTAEEDLLAHAIAIRTLSLAPDEPDARFLVAMTIDQIGRTYVGAQLYGRQKFFEFDPLTDAVARACLPQMIDPPLPASIGVEFHRVEGFEPCPPGVGVAR
jgi:hypothetical protein